MAVVALVQVWSTADRSFGDVALIELEVRRVFSSEPPLLGAYGRFGWRHPGPVFLYALALPYRLLGSDAQALSAGAVLINGAWMAWSVRIVSRRGVAALCAFAGCFAALVGSIGHGGLADPWNVPLTLVPFVAVLIGCLCAWHGEVEAALLALAGYVFVLSTHVGAGVVLTPVFVVTLVGTLVQPDLRVRFRSAATSRTAVAVSAGVAAAVVPIVIDVTRRPPGNVVEIARWSLTHDRDVIGLGESLRLMARSSSLSFPLSPSPPRFLLWADTGSLGFVPGFFVLLTAALGAVAVRQRRYSEGVLAGLVLVLWGSGALAARAVLAPPEYWLVEWLQPLGWVTVATSLLLTWRLILGPAVDAARLWWPRQAVGATITAVVFVAGATAIMNNRGDLDTREVEAVQPIDDLTSAIHDLNPTGDVRLFFEPPDLAGENLLAGVVVEATGRGVAVCVDRELAYKFPSALICSGEPSVDLLLRSEAVAAPAPPGFEEIAVSDPLSSDERMRADGARSTIADLLTAIGRTNQIELLDSQLAAEVLLGDDKLEPVEDEIALLDELRDRPGIRYALYRRSQPGS